MVDPVRGSARPSRDAPAHGGASRRAGLVESDRRGMNVAQKPCSCFVSFGRTDDADDPVACLFNQHDSNRRPNRLPPNNCGCDHAWRVRAHTAGRGVSRVHRPAFTVDRWKPPCRQLVSFPLPLTQSVIESRATVLIDEHRSLVAVMGYGDRDALFDCLRVHLDKMYRADSAHESGSQTGNPRCGSRH